jgi:serine/threonine protein kinase
MNQPPDFELEGYTIVREIGSGGMSTVYEAVDTKLKRTVAVKLLHQHFRADTTALERFRREALSAAQLDSPNIVRIYDYRLENKTPCIIMEYVPGTDLECIINTEGPLPFQTARSIMHSIASALAEAHEHGILHRDIKPANFILHKKGRVMLSDFGIARSTADKHLTETNIVAGTPSFMSPEQLSGQNVQAASDVYSWAVSFYMLVSGKLPYSSQTFPAIIHEIQLGRTILDECTMKGFPEHYCKLIEQCLIVDPEKRIRDGVELKKQMDAFGDLQISQSEISALSAIAETRPAINNKKNSSTQTNVWKRPVSRYRLYAIFAAMIIIILSAISFEVIQARKRMPGLVKQEISEPVTLPVPAIQQSQPANNVIITNTADSSVPSVKEMPKPARSVQKKPVQKTVNTAKAITPEAVSLPVHDSGQIFIHCTPWAEISIDGKLCGKTPLDKPITVSSGAHYITLNNEFCLPFQTSVTVEAGSILRKRYNLQLKPAYSQ